MKNGILAISIALFMLSGYASAQRSYRREIAEWRTKHEGELKADDGWLSVVGLFWLKDGVNTVGSGPGYDIELTDNFKAGKFGEIDFRGGRAALTVSDNLDATVDGKPVKAVELNLGEKGKPTVVRIGSQSFFLIKREEKYGIRLRDSKSKARSGFRHLNWYPVDPKWRIAAKFERYETPKDVLIANVLGGSFKMKSPGVVKFDFDGKTQTLETIDEGDGKLFIIFRDLTSKTETYGSGRFLYADTPDGDIAILDFNKAENPPCAFTAFATCPLPSQQNRLQVEIKAGEKRFGH